MNASPGCRQNCSIRGAANPTLVSNSRYLVFEERRPAGFWDFYAFNAYYLIMSRSQDRIIQIGKILIGLQEYEIFLLSAFSCRQ